MNNWQSCLNLPCEELEGRKQFNSYLQLKTYTFKVTHTYIISIKPLFVKETKQDSGDMESLERKYRNLPI